MASRVLPSRIVGYRKPYRGQPINLAHPLSRGLLSAWLFGNDGGSGSVHDCARGIEATLQLLQAGAGTVMASPRGPAYRFISDGGTAATWLATIVEPALADLPSKGPMSIAFWVYWDDAGGGASFPTVLNKAANGTPTSGWLVDINVGNLSFEFEVACATSAMQTASGGAVKRGQWNHCVITYAATLNTNPSAADVLFYVNGSPSFQGGAGGTNGTGLISTDVAQTLKFGWDGTTSGLGFQGALESVYVYNRLLSASEAMWLYDQSYAMFQQPQIRRQFWGGSFTGAVTNLATLIATQATSDLLVKQVGINRSVSQATATIQTRQTIQTRIATQAQATVLFKQVNAIRIATQAQTARLATVFGHPLVAVQATVASLTRQTNVIRIATQATADFMTRQVNAIRIAFQAQTASTTRQTSKTLIATQATADVLTKQAQIIRIATQAQTAILQTARTLARPLIATQAQAATLFKQVGKVLTATQAQAVTQLRSIGVIRIASQATSALLTKLASKILVASQGQAASQVRQANVIRIVSQAATALMTAVKQASGLTASFIVTQASPATLTKQVNATRIAVQNTTASLMRQTAKLLFVAQATSALVTRVTQVIRIATQPITASISAASTRLRQLIATQGQTATLTALKVFTRSLTATQAQTTSLQRTVNVIRIATQAVTVQCRRVVAITRIATQGQSAFIRRTVNVTRIATQGTTLLLSRQWNTFLRAVQNTLASISSLFTHGQPRVLTFLAASNTAKTATAQRATVLAMSSSRTSIAQGFSASKRQPAFTSAYAALIIADGAKHFWRLDETVIVPGPGSPGLVDSVTSLLTYKGFTSIGSVGVTLGQTGLVGDGAAVSFTGVDVNVADSIVTPHLTMANATDIIDGTSAISIEFWVTVLSLPLVESYLINFPFSAGVSRLGLATNGALLWRLHLNSFDIFINSFGTLQVGTTYHIVVTYNSGVGLAIYRQGAVMTSASSSGVMSLGSEMEVAGSQFTGFGTNVVMDEVAIYDHALTPAQVLAHYNARTLLPTALPAMLAADASTTSQSFTASEAA